HDENQRPRTGPRGLPHDCLGPRRESVGDQQPGGRRDVPVHPAIVPGAGRLTGTKVLLPAPSEAGLLGWSLRPSALRTADYFAGAGVAAEAGTSGLFCGVFSGCASSEISFRLFSCTFQPRACSSWAARGEGRPESQSSRLAFGYSSCAFFVMRSMAAATFSV